MSSPLDHALTPEPPDELVHEAGVVGEKAACGGAVQAYLLARFHGDVLPSLEPERAIAVVVEQLEAGRRLLLRIDLVERPDVDHHHATPAAFVVMNLRPELVVEGLREAVLRHVAKAEPGTRTRLNRTG